MRPLAGLAVAGLAAALAALVVGAAPVEAAFPGGNGRIAFVSNPDGNEEIYTMTREGTLQENVTSFAGAHEYNPAI